MLHADFILDASRSHVELDKEWNVELRYCIEDTTVKAFRWLATDPDSPIPLLWPSYLDCFSRVNDPYFRQIVAGVERRLRSLPLVRVEAERSQDDSRPQFCCPTNATLVGKTFRRDASADSLPLLDHPTELSLSVSSDYGPGAQDSLADFGVARLKYFSFSQRFARLIARYPEFFRRKLRSWHSEVASVLLKHPWMPDLRQDLKSSKIVPLEDGTWSVAKSNTIFLPGKSEVPIPSGFDISTVDVKASRDRSRRLLFEELGLERCDPKVIHRLILSKHRQQDWSRDQLLEQAVYLFSTNFSPENASFSFFNSNGKVSSNPLVLLSQKRDTQLNSFFERDPLINWLHKDYRSPPTIESHETARWFKWLKRWNNVLDDVPVSTRNGYLSGALKRLHHRDGSAMALAFLRQSLRPPLKNQDWCWHVGNLQVATSHGTRTLHKTALPSLSSQADGMVPLVNVDDPESDWTFLCHFGVCVSVDRAFLLHQLNFLKGGGQTADLFASASSIYRKMAQVAKDGSEEPQLRQNISRFFFDQRLISTTGKTSARQISSCRKMVNGTAYTMCGGNRTSTTLCHPCYKSSTILHHVVVYFSTYWV